SLYRVHDQKSLAICRDPELVLEEVVITVREQFPGHGRFDFRSGPDLSAHQVSGWPRKNSSLPSFLHTGRLPPPLDIWRFTPKEGKEATNTSSVPDSAELYATNCPSGEKRKPNVR